MIKNAIDKSFSVLSNYPLLYVFTNLHNHGCDVMQGQYLSAALCIRIQCFLLLH